MYEKERTQKFNKKHDKISLSNQVYTKPEKNSLHQIKSRILSFNKIQLMIFFWNPNSTTLNSSKPVYDKRSWLLY